MTNDFEIVFCCLVVVCFAVMFYLAGKADFLTVVPKIFLDRLEELNRKHGEWIKHKPDPEAMKQWHDLGIAKGMSENSIFWSCSCCNGWGTPAHKYCSQCGAKMDLKEGAENEINCKQ